MSRCCLPPQTPKSTFAFAGSFNRPGRNIGNLLDVCGHNSKEHERSCHKIQADFTSSPTTLVELSYMCNNEQNEACQKLTVTHFRKCDDDDMRDSMIM